ncbi:MAG: hypothetical protein K2K51_04030 [Bacteroidales bacterium]|nr:hypothetical protein [Bacteroidales bacterium]
MDGHKNRDDKFWSIHSNSPAYHNWCGLAFERICLLHSKQIKHALGIAGVSSAEYAWRSPASNTASGAEIDLLIDRSDQVINVCEIKFHNGPFTISKQYDASLQNKLNLFRETTRTNKALLLTLITAYGLTDNPYAMSINNQITADALFAI